MDALPAKNKANRFQKMMVKEEVSNYEAYAEGKVANPCKSFQVGLMSRLRNAQKTI